MIQVILGSIVFSGVTFIVGYYKGRSAEKVKQLKLGIEDAIESNKRQAKRSNDSINDVRRRLSTKYVRK